jgi:hypothetical protein
MAGVAWKSGNVVEYESLLNEALDISKSIVAISLDGSGNGYTTLGTTLEPHMLSGTQQASAGRRGSSAPRSSG